MRQGLAAWPWAPEDLQPVFSTASWRTGFQNLNVRDSPYFRLWRPWAWRNPERGKVRRESLPCSWQMSGGLLSLAHALPLPFLPALLCCPGEVQGSVSRMLQPVRGRASSAWPLDINTVLGSYPSQAVPGHSLHDSVEEICTGWKAFCLPRVDKLANPEVTYWRVSVHLSTTEHQTLTLLPNCSLQ